MPLQRVRGLSFIEEYASATLRKPRHEASNHSPINQSNKEESNEVSVKPAVLLAPKETRMKDRITVVLDLDETLVYAREGPLYVRPGISSLLQFLNHNCETVVWTAAIKQYAEAVVRLIDNNIGSVHHTISRDSAWCCGASCRKDLSRLGRDTQTTILFENTPDCMRGFEENSVLVADYEGGELEDHTLCTILKLLRDLLRRRSETNISVPEYIRTSTLLNLREVPTDAGGVMQCYCLNPITLPVILGHGGNYNIISETDTEEIEEIKEENCAECECECECETHISSPMQRLIPTRGSRAIAAK